MIPKDAGGSSSNAVEVEGKEVHAAHTEEPRADDASETEEPAIDALHEQQEQIKGNRDTARRGQKRQAEKTLEMSAKRFKPLEVGQNVRVPVADVDRAKTDARNILGIVMEIQDAITV
uniref:Uncharacterized protein n=1 Tax=Panagrolaimus sp. ES5 TaxID=591445 RepID=A0AC34FT13_9BILA